MGLNGDRSKPHPSCNTIQCRWTSAPLPEIQYMQQQCLSPTFTLHHKKHRYFRSADLRSPLFVSFSSFPKAPSFKLSTFSFSPLISYPMPLDDVDRLMDRWTAPLLPSDLPKPAVVASLPLFLGTAGCQHNRSRMYDVDQCTQRRTNYFNSTAMKPTQHG